MYRLIEENKLKRLIEGNMIYDELCAQGVDNWIGCDFIHYPDVDDIEKEMNKYKKGQWIDTGSGQECSECGEIQYGYDNFRYFCAHCGAKMVEPQESEENADVVDDIFGQMRDTTEQEQKSVNKFVESISKPTGVNFYDDCRK